MTKKEQQEQLKKRNDAIVEYYNEVKIYTNAVELVAKKFNLGVSRVRQIIRTRGIKFYSLNDEILKALGEIDTSIYTVPELKTFLDEKGLDICLYDLRHLVNRKKIPHLKFNSVVQERLCRIDTSQYTFKELFEICSDIVSPDDNNFRHTLLKWKIPYKKVGTRYEH